MINFRFHIVSLIAIFLALALGVVIGAGVIDRGVVNTLNNRLDRVEAKSDRIEGENRALTGRNDQLQKVVGDLQPFAVSGSLIGERVGVVAVRGVDENRVKAVIDASKEGGATATGTLWLESSWSLSKDEDVKALQTALNTTTKSKTALRNEGYQRLAARLGLPEAITNGDDLLITLQRAGFVGFDGIDGSTIAAFPGRDAGIVLAVGTDGSVPANQVAEPLGSALHVAAVPAVVASVWIEKTDGPDRAEDLQPIRDDDTLARTVSTVDDLDLVEGPTTVVLALSDLFLNPPVVGHYGYGPNAVAMPAPVGT
jgi:hypothetical protein